MKRNIKSLVLILILISVFVFTGCSSVRLDIFKGKEEPIDEFVDSEERDHIDTPIDDTEDHVESNGEDSSDNAEPSPTIIQPIENTELLIYVVNNLTDLDPVTALVPADNKITPELVVDTVVDSMADQSLLIGVENVSTQDDIVIVSFYSDQPPLRNVGSGLEDAILNAIAQSLLENLDDYHKVIYRVEGGPYESGHIELGLDEIYFED